MGKRFYQWLLIASTAAYCWLGMQAVHELGHVVAAYVGGERVERVVLGPLTLSRTDVSHERQPRLVVWGGPVLGVAIPLAAWGVAVGLRAGLAYLFRFFAGFCLVANGAYLGVGAFGGEGDAGDLMRYGVPAWAPAAFGLVCVPAGLYLWNGLGPFFGLGRAGGAVDRKAAWWALGVAVAVVAAELCAAGG